MLHARSPCARIRTSVWEPRLLGDDKCLTLHPLPPRASPAPTCTIAAHTALPHGDVEKSEAIRRREMLASMGLPAGMEVDSASIAPAPRVLVDDLVGAVADDLEMGSSPMFSMHPVDTPARLRGGGGGSIAQVVRNGAGVDKRWAKPRAVELGVSGAGAGVGVGWEDARRLGRLTLRGGGNVVPFGSKYTAEQTKLNKQLCGAVKRGWALCLWLWLWLWLWLCLCLRVCRCVSWFRANLNSKDETCNLNRKLNRQLLCSEEKEIKRLVKEGADPSYPDCDMLGFRYQKQEQNSFFWRSALHLVVDHRQVKSFETLFV